VSRKIALNVRFSSNLIRLTVIEVTKTTVNIISKPIRNPMVFTKYRVTIAPTRSADAAITLMTPIISEKRSTKRPLWGSGFRLLHDEEDMMAPGSQEEPDRMSSLLHRYLGYYIKEQRQLPRSWAPMCYYPVRNHFSNALNSSLAGSLSAST